MTSSDENYVKSVEDSEYLQPRDLTSDYSNPHRYYFIKTITSYYYFLSTSITWTCRIIIYYYETYLIDLFYFTP